MLIRVLYKVLYSSFLPRIEVWDKLQQESRKNKEKAEFRSERLLAKIRIGLKNCGNDRKISNVALLLNSLVTLCFLLIYGCGGPEHYFKPKTDISNIKRIAVLPMENFTSDEYAGEKVRRVVITELLSRGIDVIEPGEVTKVLRESNIKSIGSIKITDIQNIGKTLGVEAVMMGSVEAFGISRGISVSYPEVTILLILHEASSGNIVWSVRNTVGGASFWTRHFGAEGITLSEAVREAAKEAVDTLF
jgi:TolB-like protein